MNITATKTCTAGKPCMGSLPGADCTCPVPPPECNGTSGSVCKDAGTLVVCGTNADGCLVAQSTSACGTGKQCTGAQPNAMCTCLPQPADCPTGAGTVCRAGNVIATCGPDPTTGCIVTTGTATCPTGKPCGGSYPSAACMCSAVAECNAGSEVDGSYCVNATTMITCAPDTNACQQATTTNCSVLANEGCTGSHPSAKCEKAFGYTSSSGSSGVLPFEFLFAVSVNVTQSITIKRLGLVAKAASTGVRLAVYTDNGGPDLYKASAVGAYTVQYPGLGTGRNEYAITDPPSTSPVVLAPGTYWIVGVVQASTMLMQQSGVTSVRYKTWSPWNTPFPAQLTGETTDTLAAVNFYMVGVP